MSAKINPNTITKGVKVETQYQGFVTIQTTDWHDDRLWGAFGTTEDGTPVRVPGEQVIRPVTCSSHPGIMLSDEGDCPSCEYEITHDC